MLFVTYSSVGQHGSGLKFKSLTLEDGLSQSNINCILQDRKGFLWFGTRGGLNRYSGADFKVFLNNPSDSISLADNIVYCIYEDYEGLIWIGTQGGLSVFDHSTQNFTPVKFGLDQSENIIKSIVQDKDSNYWVGTFGGGLKKIVLDKTDRPLNERLSYTSIKTNDDDQKSISSNFITSIVATKEGYLWVGTHEDGLNKFNPADGETIRFNAEQKYGISDNRVKIVFEDRSGDIWAGTQNGLNRLRKRTNTTKFVKNERVIKYLHHESFNHSLSNNVINAIFQGKSGLIYVGTDGGGLNQYSKRNGVFTHYKHDVSNEQSIISNNVNCIFDDNEGVLWVGTNGGISRMISQRKKFKLYQRDGLSQNTLSSNYIQALYKERNGTTWVGTVDGGLNKYNPRNNTFTQYTTSGIFDAGVKRTYEEKTKKKRRRKKKKSKTPPPKPRLNLSDMRVLALHRDTRNTLWIGTGDGGLNKLNLVTDKFTHYKAFEDSEDSLTHNTIRVIFEDNKGMLWIGTEGGGLNKFDRRKFTSYQYDPANKNGLSSNDIRAITQDKNGNLWVGTYGGGLNKFDPKAGKFLEFEKGKFKNLLEKSIVFCLQVDNNNVLWIGTSEGLVKYDIENNEIYRYSTNEGLPNNLVYGILNDPVGHLWISTNRGLTRFNIEKEEFNNYDNQDGLQSNEFIPGAFSTSKNGEMLFGGINGYNSFYPNSVRDNDYIPNVVVTDFKIFNKAININTPNSPLSKDISETEYIELSYEDVVFSFEFVALNFTNAEKNQYAYKMENFDPDWNYVGNRRFANYTNLAPGEYVFKVRASNNDGIWNEEGVAIKIIIHPPFWKTWWFKILSFIGFIFFGFVIYKLRVKRIENQKALLEKEVMERTAEVVRQRDELENKSITLEKQKLEIENQNTLLADQTQEILDQRNNIEEKNKQLEKAWDDVLKANNELKIVNSSLEEKVQERTAKLQEAIKNLVNSNQELDTFLYRASHDLKGPITRLLGLTQLARLDNKNGKGLDYINIIEMSSIDMNKTLNKLINIHSINTKKVTTNAIDFNKLFGSIIESFDAKIKNHHIKIESNISQEPDVFSDESLLKIIIENLIDNAIIFKAAKRPKIIFNVACDKNKIVMKIEDNGMGIEKDYKKKIFDMFFRGSEISQGNGLGLYLVKKAVEKLNGKIIVESVEGKYTSFSLSIPRQKIKQKELVKV